MNEYNGLNFTTPYILGILATEAPDVTFPRFLCDKKMPTRGRSRVISYLIFRCQGVRPLGKQQNYGTPLLNFSS